MYNLKEQLTKNFTLEDFVGAKGNEHCIMMAQNRLTPEIVENIQRIAKKLQEVQDYANLITPCYIIVTSGFRPKEWEKLKGRSGTSQHTKGHAADFRIIPQNKSVAESFNEKIYKWLLDTHDGGVSRKKGSFIHVDFGKKRTWTY